MKADKKKRSKSLVGWAYLSWPHYFYFEKQGGTPYVEIPRIYKSITKEDMEMEDEKGKVKIRITIEPL